MAEEQYVEDEREICFVATPIGSEGSETRLRADKVLRHIIKPVVEEFEYKPIRADEISNPGMINHQVIHHLLKAPLVVADLTEGNPNVFYELGIRHMTRKPVVSIVEVNERIPFDLNQSRAVQVNYRDLDSVASCKDQLRRQIKSVQANPQDFFNPVSVTVDVETLSQSGDPDARGIAAIFSMLEGMNVEIGRLRSEVVGASRPMLQAEADRLARLNAVKVRSLWNQLDDLRSQEGLSARDLDILGKVAQGKRDRQIAEELSISVGSVKRQLLHIYRVLGVENRREAVQKLLGSADQNDSDVSNADEST